MREHRVLFPDHVWSLIQAEARAAGVSAGQLIREAAGAYAVWLAAKRGGGNDFEREIDQVIERLRSE